MIGGELRAMDGRKPEVRAGSATLIELKSKGNFNFVFLKLET